MIERLDSIAEAEGYSRNEVVAHFLRWAIQQYEKEQSDKPAKGRK
jgi:metal-responsive CopG/Arc/MetJ family transcriptional regulator